LAEKVNGADHIANPLIKPAYGFDPEVYADFRRVRSRSGAVLSPHHRLASTRLPVDHGIAMKSRKMAFQASG